jgi:hypothetical protein
MDQFDFHVEFHSYSHITPLDFTHVKTFHAWQCYQSHHSHPQWSNVHQCGESFIRDIAQFFAAQYIVRLHMWSNSSMLKVSSMC